MLRPRLLGLALVGALCACASRGSTPAPAGPAPDATGAAPATATKARPNRYVLLGEDLVPAGTTVGAAVQRLRPDFFSSRRVSDRGDMLGPSLILNDSSRPMEDLWALASDQVSFVRFFPPTDAQARFGASSSVIYVVTKEHKPNIPLPR